MIVLICSECNRRYEVNVVSPEGVAGISSGDVFEPQCLAMDCNGETYEE